MSIFYGKIKPQKLYANFSSENSESQSSDVVSDNQNTKEETPDENLTPNSSFKIYEFLSDDVKTIFNAVDNKQANESSNELESIYEHIKNKYSGSEKLSEVSDMAVISFLINNGMIDESKLSSKDILLSDVNKYKSYNKNRYDYDNYCSMEKQSGEFSSVGKKTGSCAPEEVVIVNSGKKLNDFPIKYDNNILISLDDLINVSEINPEIEYMDNNATIIIKHGENDVLEIEAGQNNIYPNDSKVVMQTSVLNVHGVTYAPLEMIDQLGCKSFKCDDSVVVY